MSQNDRPETSGHDEFVRAQILHLAKALLAGKIGVIEASRALSPLRHEADPKVADVLLAFVGIDSETDSLPVGEVRQHWNPDSLKVKDREIAAAEQFYREAAVKAATDLLGLLEIPS